MRLQSNTKIVGNDGSLVIGHVELRHAKGENRAQCLWIFQKADEPGAVGPAPFIGKIWREGATEAIELVTFIAFVALVDLTELSGGAKLRAASRDLQSNPGWSGWFACHTQQSSRDRIQIFRRQVILRHSCGRIHGVRIGNLGLDVSHQIALDLRLAKLELGNGLAAQLRKLGTKLRGNRHPLDRMAAGAPFLLKEPLPTLDFVVGWSAKFWNSIQKTGVRKTCLDVLGDLEKVFVGPAVFWHFGMRQVALWISQPSHEPIRIHL